MLNFHLSELPFLIDRHSGAFSVIPAALGSTAAIDPRWYNLPIFILLFAVLTSVLGEIIFRGRETWMMSLMVYAALCVLTGLITCMGWFLGIPAAYMIGQHLKELLLSPLLSFLLLACFYLFKPDEFEKNV